MEDNYPGELPNLEQNFHDWGMQTFTALTSWEVGVVTAAYSILTNETFVGYYLKY